jgi:hypothetical protein
MKVLAVLLSLISLCSAEFYNSAIPAGYRVASVADWDNLYRALQTFFAEHPDQVPKFVRMAFHDVANFKGDATSTGGRGCILYDFYAGMTMNRGLMDTRETLIGNLFLFWDVQKISYGWGDAIQLAGKAAIETAFPCTVMQWGFGRGVCDGREKEAAPSHMVSSLAQLNPFLTRYNMTAAEMAVLITGSHGIANSQNFFSDTFVSSFTFAFIDSGIEYISRTLNKPEPWTFFVTWFGLDANQFGVDKDQHLSHDPNRQGTTQFLTRGTIGRFPSDMMFFPSQVLRSVPVLNTIPNATVDPLDQTPLKAIENLLQWYLTVHPANWEYDFITVYSKMMRLGTDGYTITNRNASAIATACLLASRKDIGYLVPNRQLVASTHLGVTNIPRDYQLTFSITPRATTAAVTNILHGSAVIEFNGRPTIQLMLLRL